MTDFEFVLQDRIAKIQAINRQLDLEHNAYISYSGGKDSTILKYLIDLALPNNNIPRLFINTGIEYSDIVKHVKRERERDSNIVILNNKLNIKQTLEKYGYPFKSKVHSNNVAMFQRLGKCKTIKAFLKEETTNNGRMKSGSFACSDDLRYQFTEDFKLKISDKCCFKMKKEPAKNWAKENNRTITITGIRSSEGGSRINIGCITNNNTKFHPLSVVSEEWEDWFIKKYNIELCKLYYPPYNFKRTGCKGCPFDLNLQKDLDTMAELLPNERKQCEILWKPVYKEYRRIGYRLKESLFDLEYEKD